MLVGLGGSGRQSLTRLAAYMQGMEVFQVEISKQYGMQEWRDDLRKVLKTAGEANKKVYRRSYVNARTQLCLACTCTFSHLGICEM
jgi:hypothetical protein